MVKNHITSNRPYSYSFPFVICYRWSHYSGAFNEHVGGSTGVSVGGRRPVSRQPFGGLSQPHLNPLLSMSSLGSPSQAYRQSPGSNMLFHRQVSPLSSLHYNLILNSLRGLKSSLARKNGFLSLSMTKNGLEIIKFEVF